MVARGKIQFSTTEKKGPFIFHKCQDMSGQIFHQTLSQIFLLLVENFDLPIASAVDEAPKNRIRLEGVCPLRYWQPLLAAREASPWFALSSLWRLMMWT